VDDVEMVGSDVRIVKDDVGSENTRFLLRDLEALL
jgi:hypothetical protein